MEKNKKIVIVLSIAVLVSALSYYFLVYKPKQDAGSATGNLTGSGSNGTNSGGTNGVNTNIFTPPAETKIGKTAYAKFDGVRVFKNDMSLYKTASQGEWIGTVTDIAKKSGYDYYQIEGIRWVPQVSVTF